MKGATNKRTKEVKKKRNKGHGFLLPKAALLARPEKKKTTTKNHSKKKRNESIRGRFHGDDHKKKHWIGDPEKRKRHSLHKVSTFAGFPHERCHEQKNDGFFTSKGGVVGQAGDFADADGSDADGRRQAGPGAGSGRVEPQRPQSDAAGGEEAHQELAAAARLERGRQQDVAAAVAVLVQDDAAALDVVGTRHRLHHRVHAARPVLLHLPPPFFFHFFLSFFLNST